MGTSGSYGGPGHSPLLPPWADEGINWAGSSDSDRSNGHQNNDADPKQMGNAPVNLIPLTNTHALGMARREISEAAKSSGGSVDRALRQYVRARGGASNASKAATTGKRTTKSLGGFLAGVARQGVRATFEAIGLGHLIGRPLVEVVASVIDLIAPVGATLDEAISRRAANATLKEIISIYNLEDNFQNLDNITADGVREAIVISVGNHIYERFLLLVQKALEQAEINKKDVLRVERQTKTYIRRRLQIDLSEFDVLNLDWNSGQGKQIIDQVFLEAHEILEAVT